MINQYRFINEPVALASGYEYLAYRGALSPFLPQDTPARAFIEQNEKRSAGIDKPYSMLGNVALVQVRGVLVHTRNYWDEQAYSDIGRSMLMAAGDPSVRAIAMLMESPGGEVNGLFDLADGIHKLRKAKPIVAVVDEYAYSAAYALASSANDITVSRTGGVGSIGVILMHMDVSKMLEDQGVKVTTITYGDRKADFSPTAPLSKEAKDRAQADVDKLGELFVKTVARNRKLDVKDVRKTEAGIFLGADGVAKGLATKVMAPEDALRSLIQQFS